MSYNLSNSKQFDLTNLSQAEYEAFITDLSSELSAKFLDSQASRNFFMQIDSIYYERENMSQSCSASSDVLECSATLNTSQHAMSAGDGMLLVKKNNNSAAATKICKQYSLKYETANKSKLLRDSTSMNLFNNQSSSMKLKPSEFVHYSSHLRDFRKKDNLHDSNDFGGQSSINNSLPSKLGYFLDALTILFY